MKLKYYMRGLGIGMILTTLILTIGSSDKVWSDQEIMKRAAELGMEMKKDKDENLDQVLKDIEITQAPQKNPTQSPTKTPSVTPSLGPTPTLEPTPTVAPTAEPTNTPTKAPESEQEREETVDGKKEIIVTVEKGMSSVQVARLLLKKGLVDDADDFNRYIVKAGKASIIRIGTYSLPEGASYDEIIKVITDK